MTKCQSLALIIKSASKYELNIHRLHVISKACRGSFLDMFFWTLLEAAQNNKPIDRHLKLSYIHGSIILISHSQPASNLWVAFVTSHTNESRWVKISDLKACRIRVNAPALAQFQELLRLDHGSQSCYETLHRILAHTVLVEQEFETVRLISDFGCFRLDTSHQSTRNMNNNIQLAQPQLNFLERFTTPYTTGRRLQQLSSCR